MELMAENKWNVMTKFCYDLNISEMEILDSHFDVDQLKNICETLADSGIHVFSIAGHNQFLPTPYEVDSTVSDGKFWIELLSSLGIKYMRVQVGNGPLKPVMQPMDDFDDDEWAEYRGIVNEAVEYAKPIMDPLIEAAEAADVFLGIETHNSYSSNYIWQHAINEAYPSSHLGWVFDVGNFDNDDMRWKGLEEIKARVLYIHAKTYSFNENGFEMKLDYPRACRTLREVGFDGNWSIEYEGKGHGFLGVSQTAELVRYSIAQSEEKEYEIKTNFPTGEEILQKYMD
jgi:sugar phosphate isomerase/epimerase